jgi:hypothetical protein
MIMVQYMICRKLSSFNPQQISVSNCGRRTAMEKGGGHPASPYTLIITHKRGPSKRAPSPNAFPYPPQIHRKQPSKPVESYTDKSGPQQRAKEAHLANSEISYTP